MREVKNKVGTPDNSVFGRRLVVYPILLLVMLFAAPGIFAKIMVPMAADGIRGAWFSVFVPVTALMMANGLFRAWRRRWPMAFMNRYKVEAKNNGYTVCPRCGSHFVTKTRTRHYTAKVGERITTTTHGDGSKSVHTEDITEGRSYTEIYHECTGCGIEAEQNFSQSHYPWKVKEIRTLVGVDEKGYSRKRPNAACILNSRLLVPFLALVFIVASAISIYTFADRQVGEWNTATPDKEPSRSAQTVEDLVLSLDSRPFWSITVDQKSADMMDMLKKTEFDSYHLSGYNTEGEPKTLCYSFDGNDGGTGLAGGDYTLTQLEGVNVLIDEDNKKIYKQGTEFYDTYAPKLKALTYDVSLKPVFENLKDGEHALHGSGSFWMEYMRKDNTAMYFYLVDGEPDKISGSDVRARISHPDTLMYDVYQISFNDSYTYQPDLEGFQYADDKPLADTANDELGQLLQGAVEDGGGTWKLYKKGEKDDERIAGVTIEVYPDGYGFEIWDDYKGFKEDEVYRINPTKKTLVKITEDEDYNEIETPLSLSEYQEEYDFLLSTVPETYIRKVIDMDKATLKKEMLGFKKTYQMLDENGKVVAEMLVGFGKFQGVIHNISDDEFVAVSVN